MSLGLVGRKIGMTRIFSDDGSAVPVTVLDVGGNRVTQIKTPETDGYAAVQVTWGQRRASPVSKPQAGHLPKAGVVAGELLREFAVAPDALAELKVGATIGVDTFKVGELVDQGFFAGYRGVRISANGKRFLVEDATVWNVVEARSARVGQAATFARWTPIR